MEAKARQVSERFASLLEPSALLLGDAVDPRYGDDLATGPAPLPDIVLRPRSTADVASILSLCSRIGQPVVIQGGRTGLSGGARPLPGEVVLSLERMAAPPVLDPMAGTVLAEAGCALQQVQDIADGAGFLFGVDIGSRGTATIGGGIATNAGGIRVLRYGMMRAQVLGVEAVLADGTVLSCLSGLHKDNSGYDLSQLMIGSEGTIGVVTRACLRLHPRPATQQVAFCSPPSLEAAVELLSFVRSRLGPLLSAFEIILAPLYARMTERLNLKAPLETDAQAHAFIEIHGFNRDADEELFGQVLEAAMDSGLILDAVVSQSDRELHALWSLREDCSRFIFTMEPQPLGLDIALPVTGVAGFVRSAAALVEGIDPGARPHVFGHLGDGNLHYLVETSKQQEIKAALLALVAEAGGSISAEHGIGLLKKDALALTRDPQQIAAMRRLKAAFDPNNILNPGRIFDRGDTRTGGQETRQ